MKLIKITKFIEKYFIEGSEPANDTIIGHIESGELSGIRLGKCYYVDIDEFECRQLMELIMHE